MSNFIIHLSGGITSWAAARRIVERHGVNRVRLVFADVIIEDEDSYRFLIEGAADIAGVYPGMFARLSDRALALPLVEDGRMAERKIALAELRRNTMAAIPMLHWICDGRDPWEVFRDERHIGNSRVAPCSKILKQEMLDRWTAANCSPDDVHVFGLDFDETGRQERLIARMAPLHCAFPLNDAPVVIYKESHLDAAKDRGIFPPRLYDIGFPHGNCGGRCVRGGHATHALLLKWNPKRYAVDECAEQRMLGYLGRDDISILTDRRGDGKKKPLTLRVLRERIQGGKLWDEGDWGACSCFSAESETAGAE